MQWYAQPEWWLFILGIPTLFVIGWQSGETRKSANAAKDAAKAALLNAQAIINAERAILLFKIGQDERPELFTIKIVNCGKVPARKIDISKPVQATMILGEFAFMSPPVYENGYDIREWLAPGEALTVATILPRSTKLENLYDAERKKLPPDLGHRFTYGQVTYFDGISSQLRHSRYCVAVHDDTREPIAPAVNDEYLECT
jgi:hypothetical protein